MTESMEIEGDQFCDEDRFALRDDLVVEEVDDEFLILDLEHNTYFGLNGVARCIWEEVGQSRSFGEIVSAICTEYEVAREEATRDAGAFITQILDQRLARRLGES